MPLVHGFRCVNSFDRSAVTEITMDVRCWQEYTVAVWRGCLLELLSSCAFALDQRM